MRKLLLALLILATVLYLLLPLYQRNRVPSSTPIISYSTFVAEARQGHVAKVVVRDEGTIDGTFKNGEAFRTYVVPGDTSYLEILLAHGVEITVEPRPRSFFWANPLTTLLPFVVLVWLWLVMGRPRWGGPRS